MEKKLDDNHTRMLRAILNKSWVQHPTKQQLSSHQPTISKTIKVRRIRHAGHCWRSRDELISGVLVWTPSHGRAKAGRPARTYIQQLCADTECSPEDLPETMDDRDGWRERVKDIHADGATWWWWWYIVIHRLTVSSYHNSSVWLDTQNDLSWDRNPSNFMLDMVSNRTAISAKYVSSGIIRH